MNINIPEPCDADWNEMKIGVRSRFCDLCTKHVVDFTKMSKTEILEYFINKDKSERTCGHFNQNQLDFSIADLELIIETAKKKKGNISFALLAAATLSLASCEENKASKSIDNCNQTECASSNTSTMASPSTSDQLVSLNSEPPLQDFVTGELISPDNPPPPAPPVMGMPVPPQEIELMGEVELPNDTPIPNCNNDILGDTVLPIEVEGEVEIIETMGEVSEVSPPAFIDTMPEYPGGMDSLYAFLERNINYPPKAKKNKTQGQVLVTIILDDKGKIIESRIIKGLSPEINDEVIRVIYLMPDWIPGKNKGENVKSQMTIPIRFSL